MSHRLADETSGEVLRRSGASCTSVSHVFQMLFQLAEHNTLLAAWIRVALCHGEPHEINSSCPNPIYFGQQCFCVCFRRMRWRCITVDAERFEIFHALFSAELFPLGFRELEHISSRRDFKQALLHATTQTGDARNIFCRASVNGH